MNIILIILFNMLIWLEYYIFIPIFLLKREVNVGKKKFFVGRRQPSGDSDRPNRSQGEEWKEEGLRFLLSRHYLDRKIEEKQRSWLRKNARATAPRMWRVKKIYCLGAVLPGTQMSYPWITINPAGQTVLFWRSTWGKPTAQAGWWSLCLSGYCSYHRPGQGRRYSHSWRRCSVRCVQGCSAWSYRKIFGLGMVNHNGRGGLLRHHEHVFR